MAKLCRTTYSGVLTLFVAPWGTISLRYILLDSGDLCMIRQPRFDATPVCVRWTDNIAVERLTTNGPLEGH